MLAALLLHATAQNGPLIEYKPDPRIVLSGVMLTPAQHDERAAVLEDKLLVLHWKIGGGEVMFVGARHVYDPESPDIKQMQELWEQFRPTIAFLEGRSATGASTIAEGVKTHAEGALTSVLASDTGIDRFTWEPPAEVEFAEARKQCGDKASLAFCFLRGYYGDRRTRPVSEATASFMLQRRQSDYGFEKLFANLREFDDFMKAEFPDIKDWRTAEERVLWPGTEHTSLNKVANLVNLARDQHLMRCIIDAARKDHRVWVTAGRSHVINYEPVLKASTNPKELELTTKRPWG